LRKAAYAEKDVRTMVDRVARTRRVTRTSNETTQWPWRGG
jgi:hypothetical protein